MKQVENISQVVLTAKREIETCRRNLSPATEKSDTEKIELMRVYNPAMQVKYCSYPVRCVMGNAPTLAKVRKEYGTQTALDWLRVQINDYQNYVAVKDDNEMPTEVANEVAALILADFYYLKMTEIMLFFRWLKTGRYGELYGRINPQTFFCKLREFVRERNDIIFHEENKRRLEEEMLQAKKAITYSEWQKMKQK